ncbi:glycosyltransferase [Salinimicrobium sp. CDJ15-81-2]|nr:glycosyltransferase [Salinimicrobium nanhaiense]
MNFEEFRKKYQKKEVTEYPNRVPSGPLVSVMVQTYQHKDYIKDCLNAILEQQTDFPVEILLGEDGSTDGTREICIEYAKKFPEKIRLFLHQPENKVTVLGITTGNFNALYNFYSARGAYVAFCEGDDLWKDPLKLQKQVDALIQKPDLAFTYHSYTEVNHREELLPKELVLEQPTQDISEEDLKKLTFHPLLSTMCFRKFGKVLPEQMAEVINVDSFLLSLLGNYGEAGYHPDIAASYYRRHTGGIWSRKGKEIKLNSKILTYTKLRDFYSKNERKVAQYFDQKIAQTHKMQSWRSLKSGNLSQAFIHWTNSW